MAIKSGPKIDYAKAAADFDLSGTTINRYKGNMNKVVVPEGINAIGKDAFFESRNITEIVLPESLNKIGNGAFMRCVNLKSINIPKSVTSIGECAFLDCIKLERLILSDGITVIKTKTFIGCSALKSIKIPSTVKIIESSAFEDCKALEEIDLPAGLTEINPNIFSGCSSLLKFVIPKGVKSISWSAIFGCESIELMTIPDSMVNLNLIHTGNWHQKAWITLVESRSLKYVICDIPEFYKYVDMNKYAYWYCENPTLFTEKSAQIYNEYLTINGLKTAKLAIKNNCKAAIVTLGNLNCFTLKNIDKLIEMASTAEQSEIQEYLLDYKKINLKANDSPATKLKTTLGKITGTQEIEKIWNYEKNDDGSISITGYEGKLNDIEIPSIFDECNVTGISAFAFDGCEKLTTVTIPDSVTHIGASAFRGCVKLKTLEIPAHVKNIGWGAFEYCAALTTITIPNGLTSLERTFYGCQELKSVILPNSITIISQDTFQNCFSLTNINIPSGVINIEKNSFSNCRSIASITIPESVINIGKNAFFRCTGLTEIDVDFNNPNFSGENGVLFNKAKTHLITCPAGLSGNYSIPNSVTNIEDNAFQYCTDLTSVSIPDSVTDIGNDTFHCCTDLTSVSIPGCVTSIGVQAFKECTELKSVIIGTGVTYIGINMFYSCISLTNVTIPSSVTSIKDYAFFECDNLTNISVPKNVTTIGSSAFAGCDQLELTVYDTLKSSLGEACFASCTDNARYVICVRSAESDEIIFKIYIPGSTTQSQRRDLMSKWSGWKPDFAAYDDMFKDLKISDDKIIAAKLRLEYPIELSDEMSKKYKEYLKRNFNKAFEIIVETEDIKLLELICREGCVTAKNIDNLIQTATHAELAAYLLDYKNKSFGAEDYSKVIENELKINPNSIEEMKKVWKFKDNDDGTKTIIVSGYKGPDREIEIPSKIGNKPVTKIGNFYRGSWEPFDYNEPPIKVIIPDSVISICDSAFRGCSSLTSVTIGNSVMNIDKYAFKKCIRLVSVTIPASVKSIKPGTFEDCTSLESVTVSKMFKIGHSVFESHVKIIRE